MKSSLQTLFPLAAQSILLQEHEDSFDQFSIEYVVFNSLVLKLILDY
jgi:hypothetical protein